MHHEGGRTMDNSQADNIRKEITRMVDRMTLHELSMVYSLARHIDTRTTDEKKAPRQ